MAKRQKRVTRKNRGKKRVGKKAMRKAPRKTAKKARKTGKKRKLNPFFKLMLDAKKNKLPSFKYNGKTYVGKKDHRLGMVYKKK